MNILILHYSQSKIKFLCIFIFFINVIILTNQREYINLGFQRYIKVDSNEISFDIILKYFEKEVLYILINSSINTYAYFSIDEQNPNNQNTLFKSPLYGTNAIIVPKSYIKSNNYGYLSIKCDSQCNFFLHITAYDAIPLYDDRSISFKGYSDNSKYYIKYYNDDTNTLKRNLLKTIKFYSNDPNGFTIEVYYHKKINKKLCQVDNIYSRFLYTYTFNAMEFPPCEESKCFFMITISTIRPSAYMTIDLEKRDEGKTISDIGLNIPINGIIPSSKVHCFEIINAKEDHKEYTINFFIENEINSIVYYDDNKKIILKRSKYVTFVSKQIKHNKSKFCIQRYLFPFNDYDYTPYTFIVYQTEEIIHSQPFISMISNGYEVMRFLKKGNVAYYRPSSFGELQGETLYCYIKLKKGDIIVNKSTCKDFPFCNYEYTSPHLQLYDKYLYHFNNEYTFQIKLPYDHNDIYNSTQFLFKVQCSNSSSSTECEYIIMFYTHDDEIHIYPKEKFSLITQSEIYRDIKFYFKDNNITSIYYTTYSHFSHSYTELKEKPITNRIHISFNGNLQEIEFNNNSDNPNFNSLVTLYSLSSNSYDYDYVSYSLSYSINKDEAYYYLFLWSNEDIIFTLSNDESKKMVYIENMDNYIKETTVIALQMSGCVIDVKFNGGIRKYISLENDFVYYEVEDDEKENDFNFKVALDPSHHYESICIVHFTSYNIDIVDGRLLRNKGTILLQENTAHKGIIANIDNKNNYDFESFAFKKFLNIVRYEYLIMDTSSYIIINLSYGENARVDMEYAFDEEDNDFFLNTLIFYYPRIAIINPNEFPFSCQSEKHCKLILSLRLNNNGNSNISLLKYSISIKSNSIIPVYLESNNLKNDITINNNIQYYYNNIRFGEYGEIVLNCKKGTGVLFVRIIAPDVIDESPNYQDRIHLSKSPEYNTDDKLYFDINTSNVKITKESLTNCNSRSPCTLLIGVFSNDDYTTIEHNDDYSFNILEYNIFILKRNNDNQLVSVKVYSNEYILSTVNNDELKYFKYKLPTGLSLLYYELQCESCVMFTIIKSPNEDEYIYKEQSFSDFYKNKSGFIGISKDFKYNDEPYLRIGVKVDAIFDFNTTTFLFKLTPHFSSSKHNYIIINSEHHSICNININSFCEYIMPVYNYDFLSEAIISISTLDDKGVSTAEISAMIYKYSDYEYLYDIDNKKNPKFSMVMKIKGSSNNYLIVSHRNQIFDDSFILFRLYQSDKGVYNVFFTLTKKSHRTLLVPNRKSILKVKMNETIKVNFPYIDTIKRMNSTIVEIKHLKGEGIININSLNHYIIDASHDKITLMLSGCNNKANDENKDMTIYSEEGFFFYISLNMKKRENLNEFSFGNLNYYIYQLETYPIMLYAKLNNDDSMINSDIIVNFYIKGANLSKGKFNWCLKGYILNMEFIERRKSNNEIKEEYYKEYIGMFDPVYSMGSIVFKWSDIVEYQTQYQKAILIRFSDLNKAKTSPFINLIESSNTVVKIISLPIKSKALNLPQYDYYYGEITSIDNNGNGYNIYKLYRDYRSKFFYIEFSECYGNSSISLQTSYFERNINNLYKNDSSVKILQEYNSYGKYSIVVKLPDYLYSLYVIVFPNNKTKDDGIGEEIHFALKYYTFDLKRDESINSIIDDFEIEGNNTSILFDNKGRFEWANVNIKNNDKENYSYVEYFLIFMKEKSLSICQWNNTVGVHKIFNNNVSYVNNIANEANYVKLVAIYRNQKGRNENMILYSVLKIRNNKTKKIIMQVLIYMLAVMAFLLAMLYIYKIVRKFQVKKAYTLLENNKNIKRTSNSQMKKKISFYIESGNNKQ